MQKLHLIMPMGGRGYRFFHDGFQTPKPLIELCGKPFFYWAVQSVAKFTELADIRFVVLQEHVERFAIDEVIRSYYPDACITVIPEVLPGAVLTCLEGVKAIDDSAPVLFNDCDHMFICRDFSAFANAGDFAGPDGALLTFRSHDAKFSYAMLDDSGRVTGTVEKQVVSDQAICGAYYFRSPDVFRTAAEEYLTESRYEEFFVSGVYDIMARRGLEVRTFPTDVHISFGTPAEYCAAADDPRLFEVE